MEQHFGLFVYLCFLEGLELTSQAPFSCNFRQPKYLWDIYYVNFEVNVTGKLPVLMDTIWSPSSVRENWNYPHVLLWE